MFNPIRTLTYAEKSKFKFELWKNKERGKVDSSNMTPWAGSAREVVLPALIVLLGRDSPRLIIVLFLTRN